jgi:hypothetical protein
MKLEPHEFRYVACKNVDCSEPIPIPSQTLLEPSVFQSKIGSAFPPAYFACMRCGHVCAYTPPEVQYLDAGGTLGPDPEMELYHGAVELLCGPDCKTPATIHIPTYVDDDEDALSAHVSRLTFAEVYCKHGQKIEKVLPLNPRILRYG